MPEIDGTLQWDEESKQLTACWTKPGTDETRQAIVSWDDFSDEQLESEFIHKPRDLKNRPVTLQPGNDGKGPRAKSIRGLPNIAEIRAREQAARAAAAPAAAKSRHGDGFYNPYSFVPAPPRDERTLDGSLGDSPPASHGSYAPQLWSGAITVRMETRTPLLIRRHADSVPVNGGEHHVYEVRRLPSERSADGKKTVGAPDLPPTALKGMLSSAFEALTNSRMRVFSHRDPLTYRLLQPETSQLVPVLVTEGTDGGLSIRRMRRIRLPRYVEPAVKLKDKYPLHGMAVSFTEETGHGHADPIAQKIESIATVSPSSTNQGWVVITGHNPDNNGQNAKRHESIFAFVRGASPKTIDTDAAAELAVRWNAVVTATMEARKRSDGIKVENSWLFETANNADPRDNTDLCKILERDHRLLCWARWPNNGEIEQLVPNKYGRVTHPLSPYDVLPDSVRPARSRAEFSPADRLFGWTGAAEDGVNAHQGQVRITNVRMTDFDGDDAIECHPGEGRLLTPQLSPKPNQVLFYGAQDGAGIPWNDGALPVARAETYTADRGIRGRKVYPARNGRSFDAESFPSYTEATLAQNDDRTTVNSTVRSWVKADVTFTFDIHVTNLSRVELGALLWLLTRSENHRLRLGGGRALGFGEVLLSCDAARLQTGEEIKEKLMRLDAMAAPSSKQAITEPAQLTEFADQFEVFADRRTVNAVEAAMLGYPVGAEVAYPHVESGPETQREWFAANQLRNAGRDPGEYALPALDYPETIQNLPLDPRS